MSYRHYARNVRLLRELVPPAIPGALKDPAFLEGIYERAMGEDPGGLLVAALPPRAAPEEAAAGDLLGAEAADRPELVAHFQGSGSGSRNGLAPGWLWQRIQADLRRQQVDRRRHAWVFRFKVAAAAAVLLMVGIGVSVNFAEPTGATVILVQRLEEPIGEAFHPTDRLRLIAGDQRVR
jgi:hypothetical protein